MEKSRKTGLWGEVLAVRYLRDNGYRILNTNFFVGHAEIDIIAEKDGVLCIVEVKTRSPAAMVAPSESVDADKRNNLERAGAAARKIYAPGGRYRFDIVEVVFESRENYQLRHIPNAF